MTIERNKQIASEFFSRFSANDIEGALDTLADDATWWIAGRPASTPVAGAQSKTQIARIFHRMVEHDRPESNAESISTCTLPGPILCRGY